MLACQRDRFSLPDGVHYLNCAYMSPLLRAVEEAGVDGIRRKRFPGDIGPEDFFRDADTLRSAFARLLGAGSPGRVAILPAVSYGIAVAARNTVVERGANVVICGGQFPSNVLAWRRVAGERGAELRTVAAPRRTRGRGREWNERILDAIDSATAAVALPHVHWTDGTRFELAAIGERAREVGAALVIDGTQSVGALPFDFDAIRPDAVICATYKWLLGPYSLGVGWFGPRYDDGVPLEETWLGRERSNDFRRLVDPADSYRGEAARYDVGGRSNFVLLPMAIAGVRQLLDWGVAAVQEYCHGLTDSFFERVEAAGYGADEPAGRAAHLFGLHLPDGVDAERLSAELERRRIHVSLRGEAVRISPHVYNEPASLHALADALVEVVQGSTSTPSGAIFPA